MQKRPTSTPEMAMDHSIRGRVHKRTPSNPGYNHGYNPVVHKLKQFMNVHRVIRVTTTVTTRSFTN